MTYDLHVKFEKPVSYEKYISFFKKNNNWAIKDGSVFYGNEKTGVYFGINGAREKSLLRGSVIKRIHININYFRPIFFGLEAEIEISALLSQFPSEIHDPQMNGMGDGPYTREGFLRGWNQGNAFGVRAILS